MAETISGSAFQAALTGPFSGIVSCAQLTIPLKGPVNAA